MNLKMNLVHTLIRLVMFNVVTPFSSYVMRLIIFLIIARDWYKSSERFASRKLPSLSSTWIGLPPPCANEDFDCYFMSKKVEKVPWVGNLYICAYVGSLSVLLVLVTYPEPFW